MVIVKILATAFSNRSRFSCGGYEQNELPTAIETCNAEDNARSIQTVEENGKEILFPEWVTCPVCSKSIEGNDAVINNHLGQEFEHMLSAYFEVCAASFI